jgi:hypothetical protein
VNTHQGFDWITTSEAWQLLGLAVILSHLLHAFIWAELRRHDRAIVKEAMRQRNRALDALADSRHHAGLQRRLRPAELPTWEPEPTRRLQLPAAPWPGATTNRLPVTYGADRLHRADVGPWPDPPATEELPTPQWRVPALTAS